MDWSGVKEGRFLSGDCQKLIYLYDSHESHWVVDNIPFTGHNASVEDLQWSPNETEVFASCSVDRTIKIWDARMKNRPGLSVDAHNSDVNVISWNKYGLCFTISRLFFKKGRGDANGGHLTFRKVNYLMLSGADDGTFSVWDLRNFKSYALFLPYGSCSWKECHFPHDLASCTGTNPLRISSGIRAPSHRSSGIPQKSQFWQHQAKTTKSPHGTCRSRRMPSLYQKVLTSMTPLPSPRSCFLSTWYTRTLFGTFTSRAHWLFFIFLFPGAARDQRDSLAPTNFSINKFGYEVAKQLAIAKRLEIELTLNHYRLALHNLPPLEPEEPEINYDFEVPEEEPDEI